MPPFDRTRWARLSPLLDQVLDLEGAARDAFLVDLARRDADAAAHVRQLLAAHDRAAAEGFLQDGPRLPTPPPPGLAGLTVGPYTLERSLGLGGMGTVWLGRRNDGHFTGIVAVKLVNLAMLDSRAADRFAREGSILARLTHPNIARLYDAGVTPLGQPYLVLEYVEGARIDRHADEQRLDLRGRLRLFLQAADAVAHAHANLVVHRDLKPSNILVDRSGRVKLLDFGIAALVDDGGRSTDITASRLASLTPEFAAPEQAQGGPVTTATDVYALGVLLFRLITGRHPTGQAARTPADFLQALQQPADRLTTALHAAAADGTGAALAAARGTTLPRLARASAGDLETVLAAALKTDPAQRYASVTAFADDVRRYLRRLPVSARPDSLWYRTRTLIARRRVESAAAAVALVAIVGGAGVAVWLAREARVQRDQAVRALDRSEAVTGFYQFLLTDAGPPDTAITIDGMIARSEALLASPSANADHQAAILLVQSGYYLALDRVTSAMPRIDRALALVATSADADLRASAQCQHGFALSLAGQVDDGVRALERGLAEPAISTVAAADCHAYRAHVARNMGDGAVTLAHATLALDGLRAGARRYPRREAVVLGDVGYGQQLLGRIADADRSFAAAIAGLAAIGQDRTPAAGTILNNWGIAVLYGGDVRRALALWERAREITLAAGRSTPPSYLLANLGRAYELVGRFDRALAIYVETAAAARATGRRESIAYGLNGQATVALLRGQLDRAEALLAETEAVVATLPAGAPARGNAEVLAARVALARGRTAAAWAMLERRREAFDAQPPNPGAAAIRALLSDVALAQGRSAEAEHLAREAAARFAALQGGLAYSRGVGVARLAVARALRARGDTAAAHAEAVEARMHLAATVDAGHPFLVEADRLIGAAPAVRAPGSTTAGISRRD